MALSTHPLQRIIISDQKMVYIIFLDICNRFVQSFCNLYFQEGKILCVKRIKKKFPNNNNLLSPAATCTLVRDSPRFSKYWQSSLKCLDQYFSKLCLNMKNEWQIKQVIIFPSVNIDIWSCLQRFQNNHYFDWWIITGKYFIYNDFRNIGKSFVQKYWS